MQDLKKLQLNFRCTVCDKIKPYPHSVEEFENYDSVDICMCCFICEDCLKEILICEGMD